MTDKDISAELKLQVETAIADKTPLTIQGGGSKSFLGLRKTNATPIDLSPHRGVISYEPTELVITARAGTPLEEIKATLKNQGQALAFEPPGFTPNATIGGTIACAMSGPAKPYLGGTRDYILGCRVLTGHAQNLKFGGEVMKNVAGYDVSRLMTGAMGTLGVLMDVSVKVLPEAAGEVTLGKVMDIETAIEKMQSLAGLGLPVTAAAYLNGTLFTRLSGTETITNAAAQKLTAIGEKTNDSSLWQQLREQTLPFFTFNESQSLWRLSVPALTKPLDIEGQWLYDWAGMQRWLITDAPATTIRAAVEAIGGHATLFRGTEPLQREVGVFHPLPTPLLALHKKLKQEFDPQGIFNPQRLFPEF